MHAMSTIMMLIIRVRYFCGQHSRRDAFPGFHLEIVPRIEGRNGNFFRMGGEERVRS